MQLGQLFKKQILDKSIIQKKKKKKVNPTHGPRAWSLDDRWRLRAGGREQWTVLSGTSAIGHGLHVADRAQGLTGT